MGRLERNGLVYSNTQVAFAKGGSFRLIAIYHAVHQQMETLLAGPRCLKEMASDAEQGNLGLRFNDGTPEYMGHRRGSPWECRDAGVLQVWMADTHIPGFGLYLCWGCFVSQISSDHFASGIAVEEMCHEPLVLFSADSLGAHSYGGRSYSRHSTP